MSMLHRFWGTTMKTCHYTLLPFWTTHRISAERARTLGTLLANVYEFLPPYAPKLNPIERGFALIKKWIQDYEEAWTTKGLIYAAFQYYSAENGEGKGAAVYPLFDVYRDNYNTANVVREL